MTMTITDTLYQEALNTLTTGFHYNDSTGGVHEEGYLDYSDFDYQYGASKVVIILDDCVLKTSYSGIAEEDENGDEVLVNGFPDYAKMEYEIYMAAIAGRLEYFFARTEEVCSHIYEQPKVDVTVNNYHYDDDDLPKHYFNGKNKAPYLNIKDTDKLLDYCQRNGLAGLQSRIRLDVIRYFLAAYSFPELQRLHEFLIKYDINDIRAGNCGWINGKLVIFDFCGFKTSTEEILSK